MTTRTYVQLETVEDGIALVTMDRPERLNALGTVMTDDLHAVFGALDADPEIRAIVLTGAGRAFCAGADLKASSDVVERPPSIQADMTTRLLEGQERIASLHERIHRLRKPVIAAVNGAAVGGGFTLALACDVRVASQAARFGAVFITLGISNCDMGSSYFLPRLVGAASAAELLLTGRIFDAAEAKELRLVVDVVPEGDLLERALVTARLIVQHSPLGVWMTKETMWDNVDAPSLRSALDTENRTQIMCASTGGVERLQQKFLGRGDR